MPFHHNKGILEILIERIKKEVPSAANNLIVATTTNSGDDRIAELCNKMGTKCFRGSEDDVLLRFIDAAKSFGADKIIRVCADNVFLDTKALGSLFTSMVTSADDYSSYCTSDGTPSIKTHYGFWAEGVTLAALEKVYNETSDKLYHEHVTNYIYANPKEFKISFKHINETIPGIEAHKNLRLTIDTAEDFHISQGIYSYLTDNKIPVTSNNIIGYIEQHPDLYDRMKIIINQNSK